MSVKFLIIGRTATGKDTLRTILENEHGFRFVTSHTTRPKRSDDEKTHVFVTPEEADAVPDTDKITKTVIGDYEYFTTKEQVDNADAYIIDPIGMERLIKNMPDTVFEVIHLQAADTETQKEMAIARENDPEKACEIFETRSKDENDQFTAFEKQIEEQTFGNQTNCRTLMNFLNTYDDTCLHEIAFSIVKRKTAYNALTVIIKDMIEKNLLNTENGRIIVYKQYPDTKEIVKEKQTVPQFISELLSDPEGLGLTMTAYLSTPGNILTAHHT